LSFKKLGQQNAPTYRKPGPSNKFWRVEKDEKTKPDWKDYVAITVALIETILLPIVVILVLLIIVYIILVVR
jgi:hypothetical protein